MTIYERLKSCRLNSAKMDWLFSESFAMWLLNFMLILVTSVHYVDFNKRLDGMTLFEDRAYTALACLLMHL